MCVYAGNKGSIAQLRPLVGTLLHLAERRFVLEFGNFAVHFVTRILAHNVAVVHKHAETVDVARTRHHVAVHIVDVIATLVEVTDFFGAVLQRKSFVQVAVGHKHVVSVCFAH